VRAAAPADALRNISGAENERVACGNTVLCKRSLAGFLITRAGTVAGVDSSDVLAMRPVNFLKRSRNGIVIA